MPTTITQPRSQLLRRAPALPVAAGTTFEQEIACSNPTPLACSTTATLTNTLALDATVFPDGGGGPAQEGLQCLIHENGGNGSRHPQSGRYQHRPQLSVTDSGGKQPSLESLPEPGDIGYHQRLAGDSADLRSGFPPLHSRGGSARDDPLDSWQLFINKVYPPGGGPKACSFQATVVNVSGCGSGASDTPVYSGGSSAVPVRLIH
jgi:hypothetical protein